MAQSTYGAYYRDLIRSTISMNDSPVFYWYEVFGRFCPCLVFILIQHVLVQISATKQVVADPWDCRGGDLISFSCLGYEAHNRQCPALCCCLKTDPSEIRLWVLCLFQFSMSCFRFSAMKLTTDSFPYSVVASQRIYSKITLAQFFPRYGILINGSTWFCCQRSYYGVLPYRLISSHLQCVT